MESTKIDQSPYAQVYPVHKDLDIEVLLEYETFSSYRNKEGLIP